MGKYHRKYNKNKYKFNTNPQAETAPTADIQIAGLTKKPSHQGQNHHQHHQHHHHQHHQHQQQQQQQQRRRRQQSGSDRPRETSSTGGISIAGKHKGSVSQHQQQIVGKNASIASRLALGKNDPKDRSGLGIAGLSHSASDSGHKRQDVENNENGIVIGGKAGMGQKQRQQQQHVQQHRGYHPYQHGRRQKWHQKGAAEEKMSNDSDDSITKGIEIKRPGNRGKEQERGVLDAARERKNRSIFGYHMSQVVHQDNMDRIATETAAKLVSSGFNNVLLNQQQQQQQQQQGISNSDLATFLRGLGDYMTATASTIVKVAGASSSTAASGGTAESDRVQTPSSLPLQPPPLPLQPPLLQPRGGMAVPADDRASARQTTGTRSAAIPGHRSRNKNNNKASLSTGQSSAMDVDHATDLGKRQQVSGYSGRRAEPSEALDFELDVSDIE